MKSPFSFSLLSLALLVVASSCGPAGTTTASEPESGTGGEVKVAPDAPAAPTGEGELKGTLEVQAFKGGYGLDFYEDAAKKFSESHPDLIIKVEGNPRVWEQLKPRLVAGDPPDLMYPGWGMDHWALVADGQLMTLDAALDSPAAGGNGTWRDTFEPALLKLGQQNGRTYVLPYFFNVNGWWYDKSVFDANGWAPPQNYTELLSLCEKIKAKGIAPITYQGKYPYYMMFGMVLPWARSAGGAEVIDRMQRLEPGAWKDPAVLKAAEMIVELRDKGYFETGATAMTHTESQADFVVGKAAMIPCGTWLFSEMKDNLKSTNQLTFFLPPVLGEGKGDPGSVIVSIEPWMIPAKAKNPDAAVAYYKYMTAVGVAKRFVATKGTLTAIKGSDEGSLLPVLQEPSRIFKASGDVWSWQVRDWYKEMHTEVENALTSLLNKELTPEQFVDRCEAAAEKTRYDASIVKHTL
ncbi:MAG: extracellular solute-binding protein [Fimbriimonadaceae bacterium]|nr:extracellular solute-binding protein [Fimbriimonadaceae bacterium]